MSLEQGSEWILVDNLKSKEKEIRQKNSLEEKDKGYHWAAYRTLLNQGLENSRLATHCLYGFRAGIYAQIVSKIIKGKIKNKLPVIADIGCGAGFVARELGLIFPGGRIIGYDISQDAIEYANKHLNKAEFHCLGIEPNSRLGVKFDVIHAGGFYPFCRTNEAQFHLDHLKLFSRHLNDSGIIILSLRHSEMCVLNTLKLIENSLPDIGLSPKFDKFLNPYTKLYALTRNIAAANLLTYAVNRLFKKPSVYFLVFKKCAEFAEK